MYRDEKLEENSNCKGKKMNWKRIQSVKQEGYEVEFGKKWERNIFFFKKYRKLPIKIFL